MRYDINIKKYLEEKRVLTPDLGGSAKTNEVGDEVACKLEENMFKRRKIEKPWEGKMQPFKIIGNVYFVGTF